MKGDSRPDLVPACCAHCRADVVDGTNDEGSPTFWAQHEDTSHQCASGAEALQWIAEQHLVTQAVVGVPANEDVTASVEIEGAPI